MSFDLKQTLDYYGDRFKEKLDAIGEQFNEMIGGLLGGLVNKGLEGSKAMAAKAGDIAASNREPVANTTAVNVRKMAEGERAQGMERGKELVAIESPAVKQEMNKVIDTFAKYKEGYGLKIDYNAAAPSVTEEISAPHTPRAPQVLRQAQALAL